MSSWSANSGGRRRVSGTLKHGARGLHILTDSGELWVLDNDDIDQKLLGHRVTAEGTLVGYDRLALDWIGQAS